MGIHKLFIFIFLLNSGIVHARQQIPFGFFRPAAADVTPDPIDWADFSAPNDAVSSIQTFTGITQTISIRISSNGNASFGSSFSINGGAFTMVGMGFPAEVSININNGDTLQFKFGANTCVANPIQVFNDSDGGALIDSMTGEATSC